MKYAFNAQMTVNSDTGKQASRRIRSFVRRAGRITPAQQRALDEHWPVYGIDYTPGLLDLDAVFGRRAGRVLEIGFGNGELLLQTAAATPDLDYLGIEVHEPGVGHCLLGLHEQQLTNVRLSKHDAIEVLNHQLPDDSLHGLHLFFPDPWPKKRQHKRRIVQPAFVELMLRKLKSSGYFRVATDWQHYAGHIAATMAASDGFTIDTDAGGERPETKFELRGKRLGHRIWEQVYRRR